MIALRLIIFTFLIPGTIGVYIPRWVLRMYPDRFDIGEWQYAGLLPMLAGFALYLVSALAFLNEGGGTPAIWFTKPFRLLIGEEPVKLVRGKLYQFTRNPMYIGVLLVIIGTAIWFESEALLFYAALILLFFHLAVVFIEEPHLRKKNGASYNEYCRVVPRWIGFRKPEK